MDPQLKVFLQSLRGAQSTIVLAYLLARQAMTIEELVSNTGLNRDTVRDAVNALAGKQLLFKQLGEHGRATWLPRADTLFGAFLGMRKFSDSSCDDDDVKNKLLREDNNIINTEGVRKISDSAASLASLEALAELKIYGATARQVAELEWVDPDYIRAHVEAAKENPRIHNPKGFALTQMLEHVPAPERVVEAVEQEQLTWKDVLRCQDCGQYPCECEHSDDCECIECKRNHPERFCQFQIVQPAKFLGASIGWRQEYTITCNVPLEPGQTACARHNGSQP
jgi:hypothetical protein